MTPCQVMFLLHTYSSHALHPDHDAPAYEEARDMFLNHEAIAPSTMGDGFMITAIGRAWVNAILATRKPDVRYFVAGTDQEIK